MNCIAMQQLQYEGIWIITTLPTWTKHIITHRAAHVMICPHRARVGKYKTLIWSADTLWENWCQKWGKGVFETHFDSSVFTRWLLTVLVMESLIPRSLLPAWCGGHIHFLLDSFYHSGVFSEISQGTLQILWEWGLDFLRLRDRLVCIWETLRLVCKTYS